MLIILITLIIIAQLHGEEEFYTHNNIAWNASSPLIKSYLSSKMRLYGEEQYNLESHLNVDLNNDHANFRLHESKGGVENFFTDASATYSMENGQLTFFQDCTRVQGELVFNATLGWSSHEILIRSTLVPTIKPTVKPTVVPTLKPVAKPTAKPVAKPTPSPSASPTVGPTLKPVAKPTAKPVAKPTLFE